MISRQLGMQGNAAMYSNANVPMQAFDCCCTDQEHCRRGGAQALVCNDWQPSAWDLITHAE